MKGGLWLIVVAVLYAVPAAVFAGGEELFPGLYASADGLNFTLHRDLLPAWPAAVTSEPAEPDGAALPARITDPQVLNFNVLPHAPWTAYACGPDSSASVSQGVLMIDSPSCYEFMLSDPNGVWNRYVSNRRGWVIQAGLTLDDSTQPECQDYGAVQVWAHDHTNLVIIGFSPNEVCLAYPEVVTAPVLATDCYHVYRIEGRGSNIKIYVDGNLVIDHNLQVTGAGTDMLSFGDGTGYGYSLSYWDYFSYDVFPRLGRNIPLDR